MEKPLDMIAMCCAGKGEDKQEQVRSLKITLEALWQIPLDQGYQIYMWRRLVWIAKYLFQLSRPNHVMYLAAQALTFDQVYAHLVSDVLSGHAHYHC